jgi:glyoxylase-like metal-dependent hydrolase (beta-lactamase superfamily II)
MTGGGNWTYFIDGAVPTLIDAGTGEPAHLDAIATARSRGPERVLVTHAHVDHASGAPAIRTRWPSTRFGKWPWPAQDARYDVAWEPLVDAERLPAGDDELIVIYTPGHAPDHLSFWHEPTRTLFTGDLVVLGSSVVIQASNGGNLADYLRSLERVRALAARTLMPAHGPVIDQPAPLIQQYLDHRREREQQVVEALSAGVTAIGDMVARIYRDLDPALVPMARESVLAHLEKLESEGRACRHQGGWALY